MPLLIEISTYTPGEIRNENFNTQYQDNFHLGLKDVWDIHQMMILRHQDLFKDFPNTA